MQKTPGIAGYTYKSRKKEEEPKSEVAKDPVRGPELRIQKLNTNLGIHPHVSLLSPIRPDGLRSVECRFFSYH